MAVYPVLRMGDPRLTRRCREVEHFATAELRALVQDLLDTMAAEDGAGLAAPQIGVDLRVVVFGVAHNERYPEAPEVPFTALANPAVTPVDDAMEEDWEGCLSVPGLRGRVPRYTQITYCGRTPEGEWIERQAQGFHARVVQHECDHLDGLLYPQRMVDLSSLGFTDELIAADPLGRQPCDTKPA